MRRQASSFSAKQSSGLCLDEVPVADIADCRGNLGRGADLLRVSPTGDVAEIGLRFGSSFVRCQYPIASDLEPSTDALAPKSPG